jgi:hypothetical protein
MHYLSGSNKYIAETIHEFHEKVNKKEGITWGDYVKIQHLRKDTIPNLITYLEGELRRIDLIKTNTDGTEFSMEQRKNAKTEWEVYLVSAKALQDSWTQGEITLYNSNHENYSATVSLMQAKLKELLGETHTKINNQENAANNGGAV